MKSSWLIIFIGILSLSASVFTAEGPVRPKKLTPSSPEVLIAVGDLGFTNALEKQILKDPSYPWVMTRKILDKATVLTGNLEVPLSQRGQVFMKKDWALRAHPQTVTALKSAGFDLVTLANNHMMDFGSLALQDTIHLLKTTQIAYAGAGQNLDYARKAAWLTTPGGIKIAFLAYSSTFPTQFWAAPDRPGTAHGNPAYFIPDIQKAKKTADLVVVSFHWGNEMLSLAKDYQRIYAKQCIDAGANLVLGHHPHVLQGLEVYRGGLIAYSLGNFAFGSLSNKVKDSIILAVDYDSRGIIKARLYPVNINNYEVNFQTRRRFGKDAERVIEDLRTFSKDYRTEIQLRGEIGIIQVRN